MSTRAVSLAAEALPESRLECVVCTAGFRGQAAVYLVQNTFVGVLRDLHHWRLHGGYRYLRLQIGGVPRRSSPDKASHLAPVSDCSKQRLAHKALEDPCSLTSS